LMADVATLKDGIPAAELGADLVATTLYGYTDTTRKRHGPAFELLRDLVRQVKIPVVLEGWVRTPDEVRKAFDLGAYAVVVGTVITNIEWLVHRFVEATPRVQRRPRRSEVE
jgi:N-acylglucosamine-6-phosphate 2-epimerase